MKSNLVSGRKDMLKLLKIVIFCGMTSILWHGSVRSETVNRVVAIVNEHVITLYELDKRMKEAVGIGPEELRARDENGYHEARKAVLEHLINEKIALDKINELGIKVSAKEVDAALEKIKADNGWTQEDLLVNLRREGIEFEKYRETLKKDLERIKLINFEIKSKIIIRDEQIRDYYERNKSNFASEEEVRLAGIFLLNRDPSTDRNMSELHRKGDEILSRIRAGEDFSLLAREFSQGPGAQEGGDLGSFKVSELDPALSKVVNDLDEGDVSGLVRRPDGFQIIKVINKKGGKMRNFEEAKNLIYSILYREEINKRYASWIKDLREKSYTKVIF